MQGTVLLSALKADPCWHQAAHLLSLDDYGRDSCAYGEAQFADACADWICAAMLAKKHQKTLLPTGYDCHLLRCTASHWDVGQRFSEGARGRQALCLNPTQGIFKILVGVQDMIVDHVFCQPHVLLYGIFHRSVIYLKILISTCSGHISGRQNFCGCAGHAQRTEHLLPAHGRSRHRRTRRRPSSSSRRATTSPSWQSTRPGRPASSAIPGATRTSSRYESDILSCIDLFFTSGWTLK